MNDFELFKGIFESRLKELMERILSYRIDGLNRIILKSGSKNEERFRYYCAYRKV